MLVIPAIDLLGGRCVRLVQGKYEQNIEYAQDPLDMAGRFIAAGVKWLHVIDLDGAKAGKPVNTAIVEQIVKLGDIKVQLGGGLRNEASIKQMLDAGVARVIIGTAAVKNFEWFTKIVKKFPQKIVLSLDARGTKVATHGWLQESPMQLMEFAEKASQFPVAAIIYTDIDKDGMLAGPNFERIKALAQAIKTPIIAAGGITRLEDIIKLDKLGVVQGVIVGRALYEGKMNLADAINAVGAKA